MADEEGGIPMRRIVVDPSRGPEAVHHFLWARVGNEFLLEIGYLDFIEVHQKNLAKSHGEEVESVDFVVTHRFSLSTDSVKKLSETLARMMASGVEVVGDEP